jgi:hypothetical protein
LLALSLSKKKIPFPQLNLECIGKLWRRNSDHFELSEKQAYRPFAFEFPIHEIKKKQGNAVKILFSKMVSVLFLVF